MTEKANAVPVFSVQQERHPRANDQHAERDIDGHIIIPAILSRVLELGVHITILIKQTQIESRAEVYVIKGNMVVCGQRHQRNIVSAFGHFLSFLLSICHLFVIPVLFCVNYNSSGPSYVCNLMTFLFPSFNFSIYPLIETVFSDNLMNTFLEIIRWK